MFLLGGGGVMWNQEFYVRNIKFWTLLNMHMDMNRQLSLRVWKSGEWSAKELKRF